LCLITILIVIPTLYDVNPTLANVYDAFEKNCQPRYEFDYLGHTLWAS